MNTTVIWKGSYCYKVDDSVSFANRLGLGESVVKDVLLPALT